MVSKNYYKLLIIGIITLLIVLLTPYGFHIDLGPGPNSIMAILWDYWDLGIFRWFEVFEYFPYYIFRFIAFFSIMRFLMGKVTKKKAIIMVIVSELIPLLISIPGVLYLSPDGENYIPIMISIPILLLYNLILIFIFSNKKLTTTILNSS